MDYPLFLNPINTFTDAPDVAYQMLFDIFQGVLVLNGGNDRFYIYYDNVQGDLLDDCLLAVNYRYRNFLEQIKENNEIDILAFLLEAEDKSPALDCLSPDQIDDLTKCNFYLPDTGSVECVDFIGMSWLLDATVLSFPTNKPWDSSIVKIGRLVDGSYRQEFYYLNNISKYSHGNEIFSRNNEVKQKTLNEICPQCIISSEFKEWFKKQEVKNQEIICKKLSMASGLDFKGGLPLFDTLEDTDGIREIRISAFQGGAIRILFGSLSNDKYGIFIGYIKKDNSDGYKENISRSKLIWHMMKKKYN